jgi:hypothetical protein
VAIEVAEAKEAVAYFQQLLPDLARAGRKQAFGLGTLTWRKAFSGKFSAEILSSRARHIDLASIEVLQAFFRNFRQQLSISTH